MVAFYRSRDNLPMPAPSDFPDNILHISIDDVSSTMEIVKSGKLLDITVMDHLVIGNAGRWISLKERGLGF